MPVTLRSRYPDEPPEARSAPGLLLSNDLLRRGVNVGLDWLFPPRCAGCGKVDTPWCSSCQYEIDQIPYPAPQLLDISSPLVAIAATGQHVDKLQAAIWSLKYEDARDLAVIVGQRLGDCLARLDWTIDMIVPVPLYTSRLHERGYNQSQLIGAQVARMQALPMLPQAITRQTETRSQVRLNMRERQQNMENAFIADGLLVRGKTILLIDDVYTTGATLGACALAALDAGAVAVYGLIVTMA